MLGRLACLKSAHRRHSAEGCRAPKELATDGRAGGRVRAVGYRVWEAFESEKSIGPATDCASTRRWWELIPPRFEPKKLALTPLKGSEPHFGAVDENRPKSA